MPTSRAYLDFIDALGLAEALLELELLFDDPPPDKDRKAVEGLRGGTAVLMVAAFENYLKELIEEHLDELTRLPKRFKIEHVPPDMHLSNWDFLVVSSTKAKKDDKIQEYDQMARLIVSGVFAPQSFTDAVRSNPDSKKLKEMFRRLGISNCYSVLKTDFDVLWGVATANTFISDYLDSILQRRHRVAHTASVLSVARGDLQESLRFLKALGQVCDTHLAQHIDAILNPPP